MFVVALLLIAAAVVLTIGVVGASTESADLEAFMISVPATVATVFLTGVIAGCAFLVGLWLLKVSAKQTRKRRAERRTREEEHRRRLAELEKEKEQLQNRVAQSTPPEPPSDRA